MTNTQVSHASDAPPSPPSTRQVVEDVEAALLLASTSPVGDVADAVRERDIAVRGVGHARGVAEDPVHDPAANLRLLAMGARMVLRYGSGGAGAVR
ncbi:hypothetical protein AB0H29_31270 [Streptomyces thermolilacinus]